MCYSADYYLSQTTGAAWNTRAIQKRQSFDILALYKSDYYYYYYYYV